MLNHPKSMSRSCSMNIEHLTAIPIGGSVSRIFVDDRPPRTRQDRCLAWGVCCSSFLVMFLVYGIHTSFGVILAALLDHFNASKASTAWIGSISVNLLFLFSPVTSWMAESYGVRVVTILGGLLMFVGLFLTSYAPRLAFMYLTYGVLFGTGTSLSATMALIVSADYFNQNLALIIGVIASGSSLGTVVLPPTIEVLVEAYGWRVAFRAMGVAGIVLALTGFVFPSSPRSQLHGGKTTNILTFKVLKNKAFLLWTLASSVSAFGYFVPHFFLEAFPEHYLFIMPADFQPTVLTCAGSNRLLKLQVRHAVDMGIPLSQGSWLISYLGISSAAGRLLFGKLADLCSLRSVKIYRICMLLSGLASFLCPLATSYTALIVYVIALGLLDGSYIGLMSVVTMDIVGVENIGPAWGILFFCQSFFYLLGPPAAGLMYDNLKTFKPVFYLAAGPMFLGAFLLFLVSCIKPSDQTPNTDGCSEAVHIDRPKPTVPTIVISTALLSTQDMDETEEPDPTCLQHVQNDVTSVGQRSSSCNIQ